MHTLILPSLGSDQLGQPRGNGSCNRKYVFRSFVTLTPQDLRVPELTDVREASYLFRTTGQVLGISLTGALAQNLLLQSLREKIQGPGAEEVGSFHSSPHQYLGNCSDLFRHVQLINKIRRSTDIIRTLDPATRRAAMDSWGIALRAVFIFNAAIAFICLLATLPLQEFHLPSVSLASSGNPDS